ncbi:lysine 2,3-aminomutase [Gammaproteobacteria bacterium]
MEPSRPWQRELASAIRTVEALCSLLDLDPSQFPAPRAGDSFPLRVPRGYVARMANRDPHDPLLLQVLPSYAEDITSPGYIDDPVGDLDARVAPGVLHKYQGRVLLIATEACPIHCRYCFRRHFPHERLDWEATMAYLVTHPDLHEVVLSGGDPLSLSDRQLAALSERLETVPHLRRLRIHTRMPVVLPERVDDALIAWLTQGRLGKVMVLHINHPNELDHKVRQACAALTQAGVMLLNQSVLLHNINDRVETLTALSEALFEAGVTPYYLHLLDAVQGAAHFAVPASSALILMEELRIRLPGYLVPRLVQESAGALAKIAVTC